MAKVFIALGVILILVGIAFHFNINIFSCFGNLPGDIKIKSEKTFIFVPVTSMLIISLLLTLLANLLK